ncbi:hypothetical protein AWR27_22655 [Spirosoma montaniterrae]|uniref:Uncharacterized protein n=1 Tax=Spirosoma montaniterrae TaxID=1178516 RepID=A0A1P9X2N8_9BACT|nr:hypothetical protein AWR27_22655 [Spirosoma montaniterrae]
MVVVVVDELLFLLFVRRFVFPVDPVLVRSVVFIESLVRVVEPFCIDPVPVEYVPVEVRSFTEFVLLDEFPVPALLYWLPVPVVPVPCCIVPELVVGGWV